MKAIVTVIGRDKVGITAAVCALLAQHSINILDISQTVLQEYFTMVMLVDLSACTASIGEMSDLLEQAGRVRGCPSASSGRTSSTPCTESEGGGPPRTGRPARSPRGHTAFYRRKLCSINTRSCRPSR